jgi:hypothetical protein
MGAVVRGQTQLHAAELAEVPVLHYDRHFDVIAAVTGQPVRAIAPLGSLDEVAAAFTAALARRQRARACDSIPRARSSSPVSPNSWREGMSARCGNGNP